MTEEILITAFVIALILLIIALIILSIAFWIWAIIDCVKRKFKNENEKIIWILIIILTGILGAAIYSLVVKISNPKGVSQ